MEPITLLTHCGITALMEIFFSKGYEKVAEQFHSDREYLANGHLLKAIRIAMLEATVKIRDEAVTNCILHIRKENNNGLDIEKFNSEITTWLDKEIKIAKDSKEVVIFQTSAYDNIANLLIEPKSNVEKEILRVLSTKVKNEFWKELEQISSIKNIIPEIFKDYFKPRNESSEKFNLKVMDWFDETCFIFGNILSDPKFEIAKDKFNNRLLSEIASDAKQQGIEIVEIKQSLNEFHDEYNADATIIKDWILKKETELENKLKQTEAEKAKLYLENQSNKELIERAETERKELIEFYKLYPTIYRVRLEELEATKSLEQLVKDDDEKRELRKKLEDEEIKGSSKRRVQLAQQLQKLYNFKGALENYDTAILLCPELIQAKIAKGYLLHQIGEYHKARNIFVEIRGENQFESLDTLTKVDIFDAIGSTCLALSRFEEALHSFKNGMYYIKKSHEEIMHAKSEHSKEFTVDLADRFNETYAREQSNIGIAYLKVGDTKNAYTFLNSSLEYTRNLYGEDNYLVATIYNNLGDTYRKDNKLETANEYFKKSLNWFIANPTQMHSQLLMLFANLSRVNLQLGNKDDALQFATNELTVAESIYGSNSLHTANAYMELGRANKVNGNWNTALLNFMDAEAIFRSRENENGGIQLTHENINGIIESHLSIASILMERQAWSLAIGWFSYPIQIISDLEGEDTIHVGNILADKGLCLFNSRENDNDKKSVKEAIELWRKALLIFQKDPQLKIEITKLEDNILNAETILSS